MQQFSTLTTRLGLDPTAVSAGNEVATPVTVNSIDELRQILHEGAPTQVRTSRANALKSQFAEAMHLQDASAEAIMHRVEA